MSATGIGAAVRRKEDFRFITGNGQYTDDVVRPGETRAVFVRSPHARAKITTIEGLAEPSGPLHPMQEAFRENHGLQCGYCTPGMIMAALDIVRRKGNDLDEHTIREQLDGNICRCTGYHNIVKAIAAGAKAMGKGGSPTRQAAE